MQHECSQIEVISSRLFPSGYRINLGNRCYLQVVDTMGHADGGVFLGGVSDVKTKTEGLIAFFFTYYVRRLDADAVDHEATIAALSALDDTHLGHITRCVSKDLWRRSITAALTFNPYVSFFDLLTAPTGQSAP